MVKPRNAIPKISAKRLAANGGKLPFLAGTKKPKAVNRTRKASEFARAYGSKARVIFVKNLPCIVCGMGPCDNAHIVTGGAGRKADADQIVPLCCMPMDHPHSPGYSRGHHGLLHQIGVKSFVAAYRLDLSELAADTERRWQSHLLNQE